MTDLNQNPGQLYDAFVSGLQNYKDPALACVKRGLALSLVGDPEETYFRAVQDAGRVSAVMDLITVQAAGIVDLYYLLAASDRVFLHDLHGIHAHLNRETKTLEGFQPITGED